jgi:hypothetical protein
MTQAFQLRPGTDPLKVQLETLAIRGNLLCYGLSKGQLSMNEVQFAETEVRLREIGTSAVSRGDEGVGVQEQGGAHRDLDCVGLCAGVV